MKEKDVLTKNNDFLNFMFRGTPCTNRSYGFRNTFIKYLGHKMSSFNYEFDPL